MYHERVQCQPHRSSRSTQEEWGPFVRDEGDNTLFQRALAGDHRAFAALVRRYSQDVYARIGRLVHRPEDVEDLVQSTFVQAYVRLGRLRDPCRFGAWVGRIAANQALSWHRRRLVQLKLEESLQQAPKASASGTDADREIPCIREVVREAIRSLSPDHRDVVVHHYFKGYSYLQTADLLDLEVGTVRSRLQRARATCTRKGYWRLRTPTRRPVSFPGRKWTR